MIRAGPEFSFAKRYGREVLKCVKRHTAAGASRQCAALIRGLSIPRGIETTRNQCRLICWTRSNKNDGGTIARMEIRSSDRRSAPQGSSNTSSWRNFPLFACTYSIALSTGNRYWELVSYSLPRNIFNFTPETPYPWQAFSAMVRQAGPGYPQCRACWDVLPVSL